MAIPRNIRNMYLHAAQSAFWNAAASARMRIHGPKIVAGDLVIPGSPWPDGGLADTPLPRQGSPDANDQTLRPNEPLFREDAGQNERGQRGMEEGRSKRGKKHANAPQGDTARARIERVVRATAEDIAAGRYNIEELVLPLPGSDVEYPENLSEGGKGAYERMAEAVGISLSQCPHSARDFALTRLTGDYRRVFVVPRACRHCFVRYADLDEEILTSEAPPLEHRKREIPRGAGDGQKGTGDKECEQPGGGVGAVRSAGDQDVRVIPVSGLTNSAAQTSGRVESNTVSGVVAEVVGDGRGERCDRGQNVNRKSMAKVGDDVDSTGGSAVLENAYGAEDGALVEMRGGGDRVAMVLSFALPASAYATMLLREILKSSTAVEDQKVASKAEAGRGVEGLIASGRR
jgi:tRNA(Glu) U13 pseudouridine synthase TruD